MSDAALRHEVLYEIADDIDYIAGLMKLRDARAGAEWAARRCRQVADDPQVMTRPSRPASIG